jgi:hypothetical protein
MFWLAIFGDFQVEVEYKLGRFCGRQFRFYSQHLKTRQPKPETICKLDKIDIWTGNQMTGL